MKRARTAAVCVLILLAAAICGSAVAAGGHGGGGHGGGGWHGGHSGGWHGGGWRGTFGVSLGGPWYPYYGYPYYPGYAYAPYSSYYYYPPGIADPASSAGYIEQGAIQAAPAQHQSNWWYYCGASNGYYPYVRECPGGWARVSPQPTSGQIQSSTN
jgi:hypothetical protein